MPTPSIGALNSGPAFHLLDHIAPLAAHLQIPLIVTEEINHQLATKYYPHVEVQYIEDLEFHFKALTHFDALIECKYWSPHFKTLFHHLYGKKIDFIFCPHGQSDKGFASPLLAPYANQDIVLLYGDLLIDMLKELKIWPLPRFIRIGDFRQFHYRKHQKFYDDIAQKEIFAHLPPNRPFLLYAPTWLDPDGSTSFFDQGALLFSQLPQEWNLIVKVHPLLKSRHPAQYEIIAKHCEKRSNLLLIDTFPPIHPILTKVDAYLGDASSIGYDFLSFKRPMFFFPHSTLPKTKIHSCGLTLHSTTSLFHLIEKNLNNSFSEKQEDLYRYAFDPVPNIQETIKNALLR